MIELNDIYDLFFPRDENGVVLPENISDLNFYSSDVSCIDLFNSVKEGGLDGKFIYMVDGPVNDPRLTEIV